LRPGMSSSNWPRKPLKQAYGFSVRLVQPIAAMPISTDRPVKRTPYYRNADMKQESLNLWWKEVVDDVGVWIAFLAI